MAKHKQNIWPFTAPKALRPRNTTPARGGIAARLPKTRGSARSAKSAGTSAAAAAPARIDEAKLAEHFQRGGTLAEFLRKNPGVDRREVTDRAKRYRAQQNVSGPRVCAICKRKGGRLDVMHLDGFEEHGERANLAYGCRSCNTTLGHAFKTVGAGRPTRQYNPAADRVPTYEQYLWAVRNHSPGAHDEGGAVIHATPKHKRIEYARRIAGFVSQIRRARDNDRWNAAPAIDHGPLSPSGRVSKRSAAAAKERTRVELFGPAGLARPVSSQPGERERLLRQAGELRELAARGMKPRAYQKKAEELEARAERLNPGYGKQAEFRIVRPRGKSSVVLAKAGSLAAIKRRINEFKAPIRVEQLVLGDEGGMDEYFGRSPRRPRWEKVFERLKDGAYPLPNPAGRSRRNPAEAAVEGFEMFHGRAPEELVEFRERRHVHKYLSGAGELRKLVVDAIDGVGRVTLAGFDGALLAFNEARNQLFVVGGDQSVPLESFGIDPEETHELETLGRVHKIDYYAVKDHLGDEGGAATYRHGFRMTNENGRHVVVRIARYPDLIYRVRDQALEFSGGSYKILPEGIDR